MSSETGGGGDGPANDNVEVPEAANDNVDPNAAEGGAGGDGPNEGDPTDGELEVADDPSEPANDNVAPGGPVNDNAESDGGDDGAEESDSNEAGEQVMAWLKGLSFAIHLMVSGAGGAVQDRIDLIEENLYEMSVTVSVPEPGDSPIVRAVSQEEQELMSQLEDLLEQANELEGADKEQELGDAAPEPIGPRPPEPQPAPKLPGLDQRSRESRRQAANDNDSGGGDAPNGIDD